LDLNEHLLLNHCRFVTRTDPLPGLIADWSRFVTEDGKQLQIVGDHFFLSRPLNNA
jgi:hypothetical protein